jgi:hypothetical protein
MAGSHPAFRKSMSATGPEYAHSKGRRAHRIALLIVATVLVGIVIYLSGVGQGIRYAATLLFPAAGIWFADEVAEQVSTTSSGWFDARSAPLVLRIACWLCLAAFAFLLFMQIRNR